MTTRRGLVGPSVPGDDPPVGERGIRGTTIHRALVKNHGYAGSYSSARRFLRSLSDMPPKATVILDFAPAEAAQVDFGAGPVLVHPVTGQPAKTWIFVMTLCFSRHQYAEIDDLC